MKTRKVISTVTAACLLMLSLSGCSKEEDKDVKGNTEDIDMEEVTEDVTDVVSNYLDSVHGKDFDGASKLVVDEEDYFLTAELPERQNSMLLTLLPLTEYTVDNVDAGEDHATATVTVTMPDLSEISDAGYKYDDFFNVIGTIEATSEETVEFNLSLTDDDWLIEGTSTENYCNTLVGIVDAVEFVRLTEEEAMDAVDLYLNDLRYEDSAPYAIAMTDPDSPDWSTYLEWNDMIVGDTSQIGYMLSNYFSRVECEATVVESTNESVTIQLIGTAPEGIESVDTQMNRVYTAADIYENYIEWQYADADPDGYINGLFFFTGLGFYNAALVDYEATLVVTVDDEGNFIISPEDGFLPDPYTELPINYDAIIRYSLDNLLGWGHITQEQYDSLNESLYLGNGPVTELECGPDYYLAFIERYNEADYNDLTLEFWTRESYDPGVVFTYDMTVNGEPFESGSLETEGYGQFDFAIDLPDEYTTEGNSIDLMIYGADGSLLAHLQLNF